eukprot:10314517-Ditylum_brightwellii.AAC.1
MKEYNVNIFGLVKTNLAWSPNSEHTAKYYSRKVFQQYTLITCTSDDPTSTIQKPGGVCMGTAGSNIGRILETAKDPTGLGRWTPMLFTGEDGIQIRIVVAYRVSQKSLGENHKDTAWKQ